ncbi:MAG: hypothetical protein ABI780_08120 [Ardenticatenales bacterium]
MISRRRSSPLVAPTLATLSIAIAVALLAVAATAGRQRSPATAAPLDDVPSDWSRVDTGPFSVALPPGWRYERGQGIDSFVGHLVGDGQELKFDYGAYWNSPPADETRHEVTLEHVDFRQAQIFRPRAPQDVIALFIEHTDDFGGFGGPMHLSIVGHDVPLVDQDRVVQIFRSVRFRRLLGAGGRWEQVAPPDGNVALTDIDALRSRETLVLGARYLSPTDGSTATMQATVFRSTAAGWQEDALATGDGAIAWAVAGDWVSTGAALYLYDATAMRWRLERTLSGDNRVFDMALEFNSRTNGWAIGWHGVIRLAKGRSTEMDEGWGAAQGTAIDILSRQPLSPSTRPAPNEAIAVGGLDGLALFDGERWQARTLGHPDLTALSVDAVAADEAWMVGDDQTTGHGVFLHGLGRDAMTTTREAPQPLWSIDLLSPAEGWAVGGHTSGEADGELWRFEDGSWERQPPPCTCFLKSVQALQNGEAWAVGYRTTDTLARRGVVLHYVPAATATVTPDVRVFMPWAGREQQREGAAAGGND